MERNEKLVFLDEAEDNTTAPKSLDQASTTRRKNTRRERTKSQLRIISKLCHINGFNEEGNIRGQNGKYLNSNLMTHLDHVLGKKKGSIPHEREFLLLCKEAGIDQSDIRNKISAAKAQSLSVPDGDTIAVNIRNNTTAPKSSLVPFEDERMEGIEQNFTQDSVASPAANIENPRKRKKLIIRMEKPKRPRIDTLNDSSQLSESSPIAKPTKRRKVIVRMEKPKKMKTSTATDELEIRKDKSLKKRLGEVSRRIVNKRQAVKSATSASTNNFSVSNLPLSNWYVPKR